LPREQGRDRRCARCSCLKISQLLSDQFVEAIARTLESDLVVVASHLKRPVVVAVAARGPLRVAIDMVIGEGDSGALIGSEDIVLTAEKGGLQVSA